MADHPTAPTESAPTPVRRPRVRQRPRTPQEARQWRRRLVGYAVATVSVILVVNALVGENGYLATMRTRREANDVEAEYRKVHADTQRLRERIDLIKKDPTTLEDEARRIGLTKPGETTVIIKDAAPATKTPPQPAR